jgi:hypothetical protein
MTDAISGNFITNQPDILTAPFYLAKHLGECIWEGLISLARARPSREVSPSLRPSGDNTSLPASDAEESSLRRAKPILLSSNESFRRLPMLTPDQAQQALRYYFVGYSVAGYSNDFLDPTGGHVSTSTGDIEIIPRSITDSAVWKTINGHTRLFDESTGLDGYIRFDREKNEVVVAFEEFTPICSKFLACAAQWLGLVPKNLRQASKIVELMKSHVEQLNQARLPNDRIKLTVTGNSMGGGVASYAALRNKVPAVVFNPMRLGIGARARVGQRTLAQADRYLTEVVVPGCWVSDSRFSHLYKLNPLTWGGVLLDSTGKLGNARRLLLPADDGDDEYYRHGAIRLLLERIIFGATECDFLFQSIGEHANTTYTDDDRAALATEPLGTLKLWLLAESPEQETQIDELVEILEGIPIAGHWAHSEPLYHIREADRADELLAGLQKTPLHDALAKDLKRLRAQFRLESESH